MLRRALLTIAATLIGLLALAWPLSEVGVSCSVSRGSWSSLGLHQGAVQFVLSPRVPDRVLARDRFVVGFGPSPVAPPLERNRLFRRELKGGVLEVSVSLMVLLGAAGAILALCGAFGLHRAGRRRRGEECLHCGYRRAADQSPCTECGLDRAQAALTPRVERATVVRNAGLLLFLVLCVAAWSVVWFHSLEVRAARQSDARVFDFTWYLEACSPRLSGEVYVMDGSRPLGSLLASAPPGGVYVLLPGAHSAGRPNFGLLSVTDAWVVGTDPELVTVTFDRLWAARRVRFERLQIDCLNSHFADLRGDSALWMREVHLANYNSGAGGSSALSAANSALLIEHCTFEGRSGRQAMNTSRGNALDLRGSNRVYLRETSFRDNDELFRSSDAVLDRCVATTDRPQSAYAPDERVLTRATTFQSTVRPLTGLAFEQATDDLDVLRAFAASRSAAAWTDGRARDLVHDLRLQHDPGFWTRLLLHADPEVRALALLQVPIPPITPEITFEQAISKLGQFPVPRDAVVAILSQPDRAREDLKGPAAAKDARVQANAQGLLLLLNAQPPIPHVLAVQEYLGHKPAPARQ